MTEEITDKNIYWTDAIKSGKPAIHTYKLVLEMQAAILLLYRRGGSL